MIDHLAEAFNLSRQRGAARLVAGQIFLLLRLAALCTFLASYLVDLCAVARARRSPLPLN